jgi:primosomal protein N' (replication factor Y)
MAIARIALPVAADQLFDYWVPSGLAIEAGSVVRVRFGARRLVGVAVDCAERSKVSPERIAPIDEVVTALPRVPGDLRTLAQFISGHYQQPIGQCLAQLLPPLGAATRRREALASRYRFGPEAQSTPSRLGSVRSAGMQALRALLDAPDGATTPEIRQLGPSAWRGFAAWRKRGLVQPVPEALAPTQCPIVLNADQKAALQEAMPGTPGFAPSLLQGVTGSGKTEVYFAAVARAVAAGGQALLLVPEINLTPQLEQRVAAALPGIALAVLHSGVPSAERFARWLAAARGEAQLVVGTRLAVFAPLPKLGLIVVDEEHDSSYKQQEGVRYHARDVAVYRARLRDVPVILGSATPSLESYLRARRGRYRWLRISRRAISQATLPSVRLVPNRGPDTREGIGAALRDAIAARIARAEQALVFINRRGFAPSLLCVACAWKAMCPRCAARLVAHRDTAALRCHHCGHAEKLPAACPTCGNQDLLPLGFGTQRLERALADLYPAARVLRVDRDSTRRKGAFATMQTSIAAGDVDILVGTQMLAKGHDFPRLTLVGVLGADNALYSADFRATERLFALLEQVAGRAGRGRLPGEVIVQTDFPDHPLYEALARHDYDRFADALLAERERLDLPPFAYLALLTAEAPRKEAVNAFLRDAVEQGRGLLTAAKLRCEVYPPVPAALARRAGLERAQVLVQSSERGGLREFLPRWRALLEAMRQRRVRWKLDVDPLGFA